MRWVTKTRVGLANNAMTDLTYGTWSCSDAPPTRRTPWNSAARIQRNLGLEPMDEPFSPSVYTRLTPPQEYEASALARLPPVLAEELHLRRLCRLHLARADGAPLHRPARGCARPQPGYDYPNWAYNALGGLPAADRPRHVPRREAIAGTSSTCRRSRRCWRRRGRIRERTGGGVGGRTGSGRCCPPISPAGSICAGRNTSPPPAARNGGSRPRLPAQCISSRRSWVMGMKACLPKTPG